MGHLEGCDRSTTMRELQSVVNKWDQTENAGAFVKKKKKKTRGRFSNNISRMIKL